LLDGTRGDEDHLLWSRRDDGPAAVAFDLPQSAVLVRVGQSRPAWLVAVSLEPKHHFQPGDLDLLSLARRLLLNQGRHNHLRACLKDSLVGLVRALTATLDAKDPCTAGHSERVARIGVLLARRLGLSDRQVSDVFVAGLLHDVGKIGIADEVLRKPGQLTGEELAAVREHVIIGDRILGAMPQLGHLRPGVRHHHERYDGRGYPDGLAGPDIPLLARLLAVADSCDAMMSSRRYRQALPPPEIDAILRQGSGTQWDPEIIDLFMACRPQIYPTIYRKGPGDLACRAVDQMVESAAEEASLLLALG
jgi:HD-GYP domain-containing protein (c-di-GMP phosphodiesterase class II)